MKNFNTLNDVRNFLDSIENINLGGCGLAALAMFRWLRKKNMLFGNESFTFLYQSQDYFYRNNSNVLKNSVGSFISASHIMFFYGGVNYDSYQNDVSSLYTERHTGISEELLLEALNNVGWNSDFYRSHYLPIIENKLEIDLSDVRKS